MARLFTQTTGERVDCGSASSVDNLLNAAATISARIYHHGGSGRLASKRETAVSGKGWLIIVGSTGTFSVTIIDAAGVDASAATAALAVKPREWTHVCFSYDDDDGKIPRLYINGIEVTYDTRTIGVTTNGKDDAQGPLLIGNTPFSFTSAFSGLIENFAIWNEILTNDEIKKIHKGQSPLNIRPANLVVYQPLDGRSSTEVDLSGKGNHGTVTGAIVGASAPKPSKKNIIKPFYTLFTGAGLSAISNTITKLFHINEETTQTSTHLFNTNEEISNTSSHLFNIRNIVSNTSTHLFNVRNTISNTVTSLFNIRNIVTATSTHLFDILSALSSVSNTITSLFNVRAEVISTSSHLFNIRNIISNTSSHLFDILDSLTSVSNTITNLFHVRSQVIATTSHRFNILGDTPVPTPGTVPLGNVCGNSAITLNGLTGSKAVTIGDVHS